MRVTPFPEFDCGMCGKRFTPTKGQYYDRKEGRVHCCSRECENERRRQALSRLPVDHKLTCSTCGGLFTGSKQQRYKYANWEGYNPFCSADCLIKGNSVRLLRRHQEGSAPKWGSPAQVAQGKRLGQYSLANKKYGREHPNYRNGLTTQEMLEVRSLRVKIQRYIKEGVNQ